MLRTTLRPRRALRVLAAGSLMLALAAGCGTTGQNSEDQPAADEPGTSQDDTSQDDSTGDDAAEGTSVDGASDDASDDATDGAADDKSDDKSDEKDEASSTAEALPEDADLATETMPISAEDAIAIGKEAVGGGELTQIEIDHDDATWECELEIVLDGRQHELDIDATTGEVTEHEKDDDDDKDPTVDVTFPMTPEEAIEIALGVEPGRVSGWDLDSDDGRVHYTIDIDRKNGDDDVEVEVDVETGETRIDD